MPVIIPKTVPQPLRGALETLRLRWPFDEQGLSRCYRQRALEFHPDRGGSGEAFKKLTAAKEVAESFLAGEMQVYEPEYEYQSTSSPHSYERRFARFADAFKRSRKGNLWTHWSGETLTVFCRSDGYYGWCIAGSDDRTRFSRGSFETESEALESLAGEVDL